MVLQVQSVAGSTNGAMQFDASGKQRVVVLHQLLTADLVAGGHSELVKCFATVGIECSERPLDGVHIAESAASFFEVWLKRIGDIDRGGVPCFDCVSE